MVTSDRDKWKHANHGCYYSAKFIFPHFPEQNELFSLTNLFTRNTNICFQSLAITLETKSSETNLKVEVQIICKQSMQKIFFELLYAVCVQQFKFCFCIFFNFCTLYFDFPWLSLTVGTKANIINYNFHEVCEYTRHTIKAIVHRMIANVYITLQLENLVNIHHKQFKSNMMLLTHANKEEQIYGQVTSKHNGTRIGKQWQRHKIKFIFEQTTWSVSE